VYLFLCNQNSTTLPIANVNLYVFQRPLSNDFNFHTNEGQISSTSTQRHARKFWLRPDVEIFLKWSETSAQTEKPSRKGTAIYHKINELTGFYKTKEWNYRCNVNTADEISNPILFKRASATHLTDEMCPKWRLFSNGELPSLEYQSWMLWLCRGRTNVAERNSPISRYHANPPRPAIMAGREQRQCREQTPQRQ
jgi:hypothetical protein